MELASPLEAARARFRLSRGARNLASPCEEKTRVDELDELLQRMIEEFERLRKDRDDWKRRAEAAEEKLRRGERAKSG